jgi:hypothetical protein
VCSQNIQNKLATVVGLCFTRFGIYTGIRDQQKITLLQRARAFASESISAKELEEARLGKNTPVLIATQHTVDQFF